MKKALLLFIGVLAASFTQAQVLYVNNSNGTYQAIDTKTAGDVTFDEEQQLIRFELGNRVRHQLRIIPEVRFYIDDSLDYIENIDKLLKE